MSAAGRAAHNRNQARHAQRSWGYVKPKLEPVGSDTKWLAQLLLDAHGLEYLTVNSEAVLPLGETPEERELKLRKASSIGALRMYTHHVNFEFIEYRWVLTWPFGPVG